MLIGLGGTVSSAPIIISLKQQEKAKSKCNEGTSKENTLEREQGERGKGNARQRRVNESKYLFNS